MFLILASVTVAFLFGLWILRRSVLGNTDNGKIRPSIAIDYEKFKATKQEIEAVEKQIQEKGIWADRKEWKLMCEIYSKIEPVQFENKTRYKVNVKSEIEVTVTAYSIERAITFKNIFESLHPTLYHGLGWAGWYSKAEIEEKWKNSETRYRTS
jgi:hypothetical protein